MKFKLKLLSLIIVAGGLITLNGCKEDTTDPPAPAKTCYLTTFSVDGTNTYEYTLDANNRITTITNDTNFISYTYTNDQLSSAFDGQLNSVFKYHSSTSLPDSVLMFYQGGLIGYLKMNNSNNNLGLIEFHIIDQQSQQDVIVSRYTYTYDVQDNLSFVKIEQLNFSTFQVEEVARYENFTHDGKKNPFSGNLAYIYAHYSDIYPFSANNITKTTVSTQGQVFDYNLSYTYNADNLPITMTQTVGSNSVNGTLEYTCK